MKCVLVVCVSLFNSRISQVMVSWSPDWFTPLNISLKVVMSLLMITGDWDLANVSKV